MIRALSVLRGWLDRQPPLAPAVTLVVALVVYGFLAIVVSGEKHRVVVVRARAPVAPAATPTVSTGAQVVTAPRASRGHASRSRRPPGPAIGGVAQLVGQTLMVHFPGPSPPSSLLTRIAAGQVGGVILMSDNTLRSAEHTRQVTDALRTAAARGHQPPPLIATDQEGGVVQRLPGPPGISAAQMGDRSVAEVRTLGKRTGQLLKGAGVNVDLAPVADIASSTGSFLASRSFGPSPDRVVRTATAFTDGLQQTRTAATVKHFPGLGATGPRNTDASRVRAPLVTGDQRKAFADVIHAGAQLVMVSSAIYPSAEPDRPAILSKRIVRGWLRNDIGYGGVVISDEMHTPGVQAFGRSAPGMALNAGADVLIYANSDGEPAYQALLADAQSGRLPAGTLRAANRRIRALKAWLANGQSGSLPTSAAPSVSSRPSLEAPGKVGGSKTITGHTTAGGGD